MLRAERTHSPHDLIQGVAVTAVVIPVARRRSIDSTGTTGSAIQRVHRYVEMAPQALVQPRLTVSPTATDVW